jgi:hypothetical protein
MKTRLFSWNKIIWKKNIEQSLYSPDSALAAENKLVM